MVVSEEKLQREFRPYALELGQLVYAWNKLQERLGHIFWLLVSSAKPLTTNAIWHSTSNDRAQRDMLRSAVDATPCSELTDKQKADLTWLLTQANKLADRRNDAIHSPYMFMVNQQDESDLSVMSSYLYDNPRAIKLRGKDLLAEFVWYRASAETLAQFAANIWLALSESENSWPKKPSMPHLSKSRASQPTVRREGGK